MPSAVQGPRTLYDKVFQDHIVDERGDGTILLYVGWCSLVRATRFFCFAPGGAEVGSREQEGYAD
jgi:hypothetical protein